MASINDRLEAEDTPAFVPFKDDRILTAFERQQLAHDPTRPIYQDFRTSVHQDAAYLIWRENCRSRSRSIPVTVTAREARPLSEGQP